jgi:hypothetical protein
VPAFGPARSRRNRLTAPASNSIDACAIPRSRFSKKEGPLKRLLTLILSLTLCTGAVLFADDTMKKDDSMKSDSMKSAKMMTAKGTIMKMDKGSRMMTMKSSKGKEMTMYWDDSTKVEGDMMEGSMATVHYMMHDGKMMAHDVKMSSAMKSDKKM